MADETLQEFFDAVRSGNTDVIGACLDAHPDWVNEAEDDTPPLYVAPQYGFSGRTRHLAPVIELLKARGATVSLVTAAYLGDEKAVVTILEDGSQDVQEVEFYGMNALHHAAECGTLPVTRLLLAASADPNIQDQFGRTAIDLALHSGPIKENAALDVVDLILENGGIADIFVAASLGDVERIKSLIKSDADCISAQKKDGSTALYEAAQNLKPDACKALVAGGADTEISRSNGHTPIMSAIIHMWDKGGAETVQTLADLGADINHRDQAGRTALDYWVEYSGQGPLGELLEQPGGPGKSIEFLQELGAEI